MPAEGEDDPVAEVSALLLDCLRLANPPEIPARFASIDPLRVLHADLMSLRENLLAASNGDLSRPVPFKGYIAGVLKTLQANLRHVTWQTKMVASGDLTQHIEFMGEFSQSFNAMVVQLQESQAALRLLAISDPLTGLNNRRHFFELAEAEITKALRYSRPLALMMFDIDFFKHVNDNHGHVAGDAVLKMVAATTRKTLRVADIPARYGGEEFVVLLPETSVTAALAVAERLRKRIAAASVRTDQGSIAITASFGLSAHLGDTASKSTERILSEFIDRADQALYASKNGGRNRVTVCEPEEKP